MSDGDGGDGDGGRIEGSGDAAHGGDDGDDGPDGGSDRGGRDGDDGDHDDFDPLAVDVPTALRAGAAVYNVGEHHAAHDAWEDAWLDLEAGSDDERLLHGLIQFTAVVYHAHEGNWSGATGLAESAAGYLDGLPDGADAGGYRGVDVAGVRRWLAAFRADPERVEREPVPPLRVDGAVVDPALLALPGAGAAAAVVAGEHGYDEAVVADAVRFGDATDDPDSSRFAAFLRDFVGDPGHRAVVFARLEHLVERRRREERDVAGLFAEREDQADGGPHRDDAGPKQDEEADGDGDERDESVDDGGGGHQNDVVGGIGDAEDDDADDA